MQTITLHITKQDQLFKLEVLALKLGCKPAEVVRRLIEQAYREVEKSPNSPMRLR